MNSTLKLLAGFVATIAMTAGVALAASSPAVSTGSSSSIATTSALLHGTVNPNGTSTTYQFEWGLTNTYGLAGASKSAGGGTAPLAVEFTATNLIPGTIYHYRLTAHNRFGLSAGIDRKFKTAGNPPPDVSTGPVAQIGPTSATLTGVVDPHGEQTSFFFQYGLTATYGFQTFAGTVPAGTVPVTVSQQLQGISPLTVFHYRIVAQHGASVQQPGVDMSFLTFPAIRPRPRVRARTTPHQRRSSPYVFNTSGTIAGPSNIPAALGCAQSAVVRFIFGRREWSSTAMPVQPNCTFTGQTTINHLPGHGSKHRKVTLKVVVTAAGSGYLAPASSSTATVVLGG